MSNSEKISAYLENELSSAERVSFEKELANNSELKHEFDLQKSIIEGIKYARKQELKTMLNNVPVGGAGVSGTLTFGKIASAIAILGVISYGVYHFTTTDENLMPAKKYDEEVIIQPSVEPETKESIQENIAENTTDKNIVEQTQPTPDEPIVVDNKDEVTIDDKEPEINKPSAAPMFETGNTDSLEAPTDNIVGNIEGNASSVDVEIDNSKKKYSFHYQFKGTKLHLYGDFDKDLYEILEFKTRSEKSLFLYYKENFYPLNKEKSRITELKPVKEDTLIEKLNKLVDIN